MSEPSGRSRRTRGVTRSRFVPSALAGLVGLLSAAVAVGVGELVAAAVRPQAAPVVAVGGAAVDRTPRALKEFAIRQFGERDKTVLIAGIFVVLALFAVAVGLLARRRPLLGVLGIDAFGVIGAAAALSRPGGGWTDALPSVAGALVAGGALLLLVRRLHPAPEPAPADAPALATVAAGGSGAGGAGAGGSGAGGSGAGGSGAGDGGDRGEPGGLRAELVRVDRKGRGGFDRRGFLVAGAGVGAVAALAGFGGRALQKVRFDAAGSRAAITLPTPADPAPALPASAQAGVRGLDPYVTPNRDFYRVDTALVVPQVPADTWTLRIHGMVDREIELDYAALSKRPMIERDITMTCVSNEVGGKLAGTARWLGVPLKPLLEEAGVRAGADQILSTSSDGMTIGTPTAVVMDGRDAMLAVGMNGEPLPLEHGFPVRMLVPGLYGYVSATKWVVDLELTTFAGAKPYWVERGWVEQAPIKTASRIDVPKPLSEVRAGTVAVAGVAWAQHRGVAKVEVQVDGGQWTEARIAPAPSTDLWVQWVFEWEAAAGPHTLVVRATDRSGRTQPEQRATPFPSGSTGWHSIVVTAT